jgi:hypothetical protein
MKRGPQCQGKEQMTRILLLSTCLIAAMSGQALAYSNVSPRQASRVATVDRSELSSFDGPEQAYAFAADNYRYHGGPKAND